MKWTVTEGDDFDLLLKRFEGINKLYDRLVTFPISYLGGVYSFPGTFGQFPAQFVPVEKDKQQEAIRFVIDQITTCQWLDQPELNKFIGSQTEDIRKLQSNVIGSMLGNFVLSRYNTNETLYTSNAYTLVDYLKDLDNQIWTSTSSPLMSSSNKHIQLTYIDKLTSLIRPLSVYSEKTESRSMNETLWASAAASQLISTTAHVKDLLQAQPQNAGHYQLILNLIDKAINK